MPGEDFELRVTQALSDAGGPTELALQLVALSNQYAIDHAALRLNWEGRLLDWVRFHRGEHWSAGEFQLWAMKYVETIDILARLQEGEWKVK